MQSGKLRYLLIIQENTRTKTTSGQAGKTWVEFAQVRGDVRTLSGREFNAHDKVNAELTHNVICRWVTGVYPEMRVKWNDGRTDRYLNIVFAGEDRKHAHMMILKCKEDRDNG